MVVPTLVYNSVSLGYSHMVSDDEEHVINASAGVLFIDHPYFSTAVRYNFNRYTWHRKHTSLYLPFWLSSRYFNLSPNADTESPGSEVLLYTIGTGFGLKLAFAGRDRFRVELGGGASLYTDKDYRGKGFFSMPTKNPFIPALRLSIKYLFPVIKSGERSQ